MQLAFVIPGWYKSLDSQGDTVQTIRVLSEGDKGPNYFKLNDGREMHEREILDGWEYMPTSPTADVQIEQFSVGDLDKISDKNLYNKPEPEKFNYEEFPPIQQEIIEEQSKPTVERIYKQPIEGKPKSPDEIFVEQLLKQIPSEQSSFDIPIKFTFNYDLNKLKQILKLIDTDENKLSLFVSKIISNDLSNIKNKINSSIKDFLISDEIQKSPLIKFKDEKDKNQIEPTIKQFDDKSNVSTYLNNF